MVRTEILRKCLRLDEYLGEEVGDGNLSRECSFIVVLNVSGSSVPIPPFHETWSFLLLDTGAGAYRSGVSRLLLQLPRYRR